MKLPDSSPLYIDSSILVSLALGDPRFARAHEVIQKSMLVSTSELAVVECQAGIAQQLAQATPSQRTAAEQNLNRILAALDLIAINSLVLGRARVLVRTYRASIGLRTLDAIHIATAQLVRMGLTEGSATAACTYLTADHRQHEAFSAEGWVGELLS